MLNSLFIVIYEILYTNNLTITNQRMLKMGLNKCDVN